MDTGGIKMDKLNESNFSVWKHEMESGLMLRESEITVTTRNPFHSRTAGYDECTQQDKVARPVVRLILSSII